MKQSEVDRREARVSGTNHWREPVPALEWNGEPKQKNTKSLSLSAGPCVVCRGKNAHPAVLLPFDC